MKKKVSHRRRKRNGYLHDYKGIANTVVQYGNYYHSLGLKLELYEVALVSSAKR